MNMTYQALMVLGCGVTMSGELIDDTRSSVHMAKTLYEQGIAPIIIFSGAYTYQQKQPPLISESQSMKDFAVSLGIPSEVIYTESESKDTLGNAYFTKKNLLEPLGISNIAILKGPRQSTERMEFIFTKVFAPAIEYRLLDRPEEIDLVKERRSLKVVKRWLDGIADGDDRAVYAFMRKRHPAYGTDAAAVAALEAELADA